jgi:4-amino-4-deoxy-L-arabinose transferase-like glycosyltransferase
MSRAVRAPLLPRLAANPGLALAAIAFAVHIATGNGYGYFRDELYFIVCGRHPDWGYVDQPSLIPLLAGVVYGLFPGSVVMLRLVPALAHAATIVLTAATARKLGGGWWAQFLGGLCVLAGGVYLGLGTLLSTDALQPLAWLFCAHALIRALREQDRRWWVALGIAAGLGFLSKYTIALWLMALGIGVVATPARRCLRSRYPYVAAGLALLIVMPNLLWQAAHGWPFLELAQFTVTKKNVVLSPLAFLAAEANTLNYATAPVWLAGFGAFALWRRFADLRFIAVAFGALIAAMLLLHAKPYYPAGAYPLLFAGGSVALETWLPRRALRVALPAAIVAIGIVGAPFALPILPIERFAAYQQWLGITPKAMAKERVGVLPQYYADMFGWRELAALVAAAYRSLSPEEQKHAVFFASNYGEAAAIDIYGASLGLPRAISGHNNYFLWGPRGHDGSVVIRLGSKPENLRKVYASITAAGVFENKWAMPYETGRVLWICRGRHPTLNADWVRLKHYD